MKKRFLLGLRLRFQLVNVKWQLRCSRRSVAAIQKAHEKELLSLRTHYELLLAEERLKVETLNLTFTDRLLQIQGQPGVSHSIADLTEKAQSKVDPAYKTPEPDAEDLLSEDEHDLFLDMRDGFFEAEKQNGRSEAEITRLWNETFKMKSIQRAKESILQ